jgi:ligand-binding sensor domain-containing protein
MHRRGRILGSLAACMAMAALSAAAQAAAPAPAMRPMYFEHLTLRDGLSQSTVNGILQDSQGYLWLATESGLDRYDGYSIREYRRERGNEQGLASDYIWSMVEDARGDLWLATTAAAWRTGSGELSNSSSSDTTPAIRILWPAMRCVRCSSTPKVESGPARWIKGWTSSIRPRVMSVISGIAKAMSIPWRRMR